MGPEPKERPDLARKPRPAQQPLPKFGRTKAAIETDVGRNTTLAAARELFGRPISLRELASLSGATESAVVRLSVSDFAGSPTFHFDVEDDKYIASRTLSRDYADKLHLNANSFYVGEEFRRQGIGKEVFGRMVETSIRVGLDRIDTFAERGGHANGYFTWPLFGYDGELPTWIRSELPSSLSHCGLVSDLFATDEGTNWWQRNGQSISLSFDLSPGSLSRQRWAVYLRSKMIPGT